MFRTVAILASFIGASAFAPMGKVATSSSMKMGFADGTSLIKKRIQLDPLHIYIYHSLLTRVARTGSQILALQTNAYNIL
jgi:hypothetical protein